ncbi:hypothetical protein JLT2_14 [Paraglaciecola Antarctic JLT virus 2]|nr:hypothetical protein JLT2_14 [Paraglaciecola Antarctic JLT virus 2]
MTDYTKPVPDNRTIIPGTWSDVENARSEAFNKGNGGVTSLNVSDVNSIDLSVLSGTMHAVNNPFTLQPGESMGFKITASGGTFIRFVFADSLTVKYVTVFTGLLEKLGGSKPLNQSVNNGYKAFYEVWSSPDYSDDNVILSGMSPLNVGFYSDDNVFVIIKNNTSAPVSDIFSAGLQSVGSFTLPYGLSPDTILTPTTEMSVYD